MALKTYEPSVYQKNIFDWVKNGSGNLVIEAAAGSGKTYTLLKSLELIPKESRVAIFAFNRDIINEINKKIGDRFDVDVMTLHSLGHGIIKRYVDTTTLKVDTYKYSSHLTSNISRYTSIPYRRIKAHRKIKDSIVKLCSYGRMYLCKSPQELFDLSKRYDIDVIGDEVEAAYSLMEWGKTNLDTVDFTDLIWLPNVLEMDYSKSKYDFIMLDECQDVNCAERNLVLKCFNGNTRLMAVGDTNQMIYSFAGGDPQSFSALKSLPNTTSLPLSISYRCADAIVDNAKKLVPTIERNNDGRQGTIMNDVNLSVLKAEDLVLCRNNAPLIYTYNMLIKQGKPAYILGRDFMETLKSMVMSTSREELNADLSKDGVFVRLYESFFYDRNTFMEKHNLDEKEANESSVMQDELDRINSLLILSEGINTTEELMYKLDNLNKRNSEVGSIKLSTIHKAKGLEADRVFIVCNSLMPSKSAKKDWEKKQEMNLMYVAYTRPKNVLGFIDERPYNLFDISQYDLHSQLKKIENKVCEALGKVKEMSIDAAMSIISGIKKDSLISSANSRVVTLSMANANSADLLSALPKVSKKKLGRRKKI